MGTDLRGEVMWVQTPFSKQELRASLSSARLPPALSSSRPPLLYRQSAVNWRPCFRWSAFAFSNLLLRFLSSRNTCLALSLRQALREALGTWQWTTQVWPLACPPAVSVPCLRDCTGDAKVSGALPCPCEPSVVMLKQEYRTTPSEAHMELYIKCHRDSEGAPWNLRREVTGGLGEEGVTDV